MPTSFFGRPSCKVAAYGMVTKEYMGRIAEVMFGKYKQNSSFNFLVRAKFFMRPRQRWRRDNAKYYKHPDSIGDA